MPQVTVLSAPPVSWDLMMVWPTGAGGAPTVGSGAAMSSVVWSQATIAAQTPTAFYYCAASSAGGATTVFRVVNGMACAQDELGTGNSYMLRVPTWFPNFGPASGLNPGAAVGFLSALAVWDVYFSTGAAAASFTADTTGWWLMPWSQAGFAQAPVNHIPSGATPFGGAGVVLNNDGGGNLQAEFITYNGAVILSRTVAPAGSIPDITKWSHLRWIIQTALNGSEAELTVEINGTSWISSMPFDDVTLFRPNTIEATNTAFGFGFNRAGAAPGTVQHAWQLRFGRATPLGVPVVAE